MSYLRNRGFDRVEAAFKAELDALASGATPEQAAAAANTIGGRAPTVSLEELAAKNAPRTLNDKDADPTNNTAAGGEGDVFPEDGDVSAAATQALLLDPTDRARGFAMLKSWVQGSLDIYQPELLPILLPLFVHSFLDLVLMGHGPAAQALYTAHSSSFLPTHTALLSQIRSLALPSHIQSDPLAQRFRTERYVVKMSNTVFSLLLGWLTDGSDESDAPSRRGREAMLKIINERCRIQVLKLQPYQVDSAILEEGTGLTGAGPSYAGVGTGGGKSRGLVKAAVGEGDVVGEFNKRAAGPQLKLHPLVPMSERLEAEVGKELQEGERRQTETLNAIANEEEKEGEAAAPVQEGEGEGDVTMQDPPLAPTNTEDGEEGGSRGRTASVRPSEAPSTTTAPVQTGPDFSAGLLAASLTDLPPQAPTFRTIDVKREVQRIRDARKRIRLDPSLLTSPIPTPLADSARVAALPSICAYTFHDADDGLTCSTFSQDITLMAAGFEESFVQIWSLKGEKLRGLRGNPQLSSIRDSKSLARQRDAGSYSTRRLIGHSGPVYGVDFDPTAGSAGPPRHLLSCSADSTVRLWSLDTYSALVAYRGHQSAVWDVKWSPLGTYFATAGADKTARLWSTERINPLRLYAGHLSDVDCLTFHPNSLYLATGSSDRSCRLWDVQRGACVRLFVGHQSPISCMKISPDGRYLASAASGSGTKGGLGESGDVSISLWDLGSGRRIKKMWGHQERVYSMDFSAGGEMLVTGGEDCTVRCWDVRAVGGVRSQTKMGEGQSVEAPAGGVAGVAAAGLGAVTAAGQGADLANSSADCVAVFHTKRTPVVDVHFTPRNLCLVAGVYED